MKFGMALGGGGAKGLAHIGVIEILEKHGIRPHCVAGTSIGSIIGALYCLNGSADNLRQMAIEMINSEEFKNLDLDKFYTDADNIFERFKKELFEKFYFGTLLFRKSHSKIETTKKLYDNLFGDKTFKDCRIAFTCNALDIQSGDEVVFRSGSLAEAVRASCAIPGIFPPFVKDHRILVDGGVIDNVPIGPLKEVGAKIVLTVYLGSRPQFKGVPDTGFRINQRAQSFVRYYLDQNILTLSDCVIAPDVARFHWADFSPVDALVMAGREAAEKDIEKVRAVTSFWYRLRKMFK